MTIAAVACATVWSGLQRPTEPTLAREAAPANQTDSPALKRVTLPSATPAQPQRAESPAVVVQAGFVRDGATPSALSAVAYKAGRGESVNR